MKKQASERTPARKPRKSAERPKATKYGKRFFADEGGEVRHTLTLPAKTARLVKRYARALKIDEEDFIGVLCELVFAHLRFGGLPEMLAVGFEFMQELMFGDTTRQRSIFNRIGSEDERQQFIAAMIQQKPGFWKTPRGKRGTAAAKRSASRT